MVTTAVALADMGPSPPASPHLESDGPQNRFHLHIGPHGHGRRRGHHHHHQHHHSRGGPRGHCHHHHHHGAGPHPPPPPHFLGDALHFGPAQFGGGGGLHRGRRGSRGLHHAPLHGPHHGPHLGPLRIICRPESHAFSHLGGGFKGHHRGRRMHRSLSPRHLRPHSPPGDHPHHHHRGHHPPPPPPPPPFDHDGSAPDFAAHSADSPAPPPEIQRGIEQLRQLCLNY